MCAWAGIGTGFARDLAGHDICVNYYPVLVCLAEGPRLDGFYVFHGDALPEKDAVVTVEDRLTGAHVRARVIQIRPGDPFPIYSMEVAA